MIFGKQAARAFTRFIVASGALHLVWEAAQIPLYTLWQEPFQARAFAVVHCTGGDVLIAAATLLTALLAAGRVWPSDAVVQRRVLAITIVIGIAYTVFSEWLNVEIRGSWAYAPLMPRIPPLGTGLSPVLQWLVVPLLAYWWARRGVMSPQHQTERP